MNNYTTNTKLIKSVYIIHFLLFTSFVASASNYTNLNTPDGFTVELFASDINAPRQMAEGEEFIFVGGIKGDIYAISKADAEKKYVLASGLNNSRGVALKNGDLYFAEVDKIWVFRNVEKSIKNNKKLTKILFNDDLPNDAWHGGKWINFDLNGDLYTNVGAPCNICLDGINKDKRYASIIKLNEGSWDTVARGVRNSVGFDWHPVTNDLYFGDNGRDWLGDNSPSCEVNVVKEENSFFGFPFLHATNVIDPKYGDGLEDFGEDVVLPILEIGAHVAPTGAAFYSNSHFPSEYQNALFIALHGSWNRSEKSGYKVIAVQTDEKGNVTGVIDFLTGFLDGQNSWGRPSAPLPLKDGSLLISDDKSNAIYRVIYKS